MMQLIHAACNRAEPCGVRMRVGNKPRLSHKGDGYSLYRQTPTFSYAKAESSGFQL